MTTSSASDTPSVRNIGFTILYEPIILEDIIADIVFVHGLQGHPRNTWTWEADVSLPENSIPIERNPKATRWKPWSKERKTGGADVSEAIKPAQAAVFWPYHLLHVDCPNSRILTWGYDSKISNFFDGLASKNNVLHHASDLQGDLVAWRKLCLHRPLIFVAHSLGGIVVKQALVQASFGGIKGSEELLQSTKAVLFLGTPHAGSPFAEIGDTITAIVKAVGFSTANQNLRVLKPHSAMLEQCRMNFYTLHRRGGFEVYTFQEELGMKGIGIAKADNKVVPDVSSEFPGSAGRFSINANHMMMCRYPNKEDVGYERVCGILKGLCQDMWEQKVEAERVAKAERNAQLNAIDKANLDTLDFPEMTYREKEIRDAYTDSCTWILSHDSYIKWTQKGRGLLGIRGKPGSGKSTLMKKIFHMLDHKTSRDEVQLAFFFHRRGGPLQQTLLGMFRTLLHQLLSQVAAVRTEFRTLCEEKKRWQGESGKNWDWRVEELRLVFSSALLEAARNRKIWIFIDALDEASHTEPDSAHDQDRNQAAQEVVSFLYQINHKLVEIDAATSICFSCRHFPIIAIKVGFQVCVENNNQDDIASYAARELENRLDIKDDINAEHGILKALLADIVSKASGVFMWVVLVVPIVAKQYNAGKSLTTIQQTLKQVPISLMEVYRHILTKIVDVEDRPQTLHLMQWIFLAERPLSVTELRFALASDDASGHPNLMSCQESNEFIENATRMRRLISSLSGGLMEIKTHSLEDYKQDTTVQFIHQSVNDFLSGDRFKCLELSGDEDLIGKGHHRLARSCINYLKLEETRQKTKSSLSRREMMNALPFIEYATKFWFTHAENAERASISQQDLVQRFEWPLPELFQMWVNNFRMLGLPYAPRTPELGATLLHIVAGSNLKTTLQKLLESGVSVEEEDKKGNQAMHYAARWGHEKIVTMLLEAHAKTGVKNKAGQTPLSRAAGAGHEVIVKMLLKLGEDVNDLTGTSGNALQAAAADGHSSVVRLLLKMGANVNAQGGYYSNALQAAAAWTGSEAVVQLLLQSGANVNAQGGYYGNALQAAARTGSEAVVRLLLQSGANVNAQGGCYGNALQAAAAWTGSEAVVQLLLAAGAVEIDAKSDSVATSLLSTVAI